MPAEQRYVPAAGRFGLTRLYDPVLALTMRERTFRRAMLALALRAPRPGVVLDLGCGTGTLAGMLAAADAQLRVLGVDGDPAVLAIAREKAGHLGERVEFIHALAAGLPVADGGVDVVVSSLLLHHLAPAVKRAALAEARRVLSDSGRLVIADWGPAHGPATRAAFFTLQLLDGFENTRAHVAGQLPALIAEAGFTRVSVRQRWRTVWGSLELIAADAI